MKVSIARRKIPAAIEPTKVEIVEAIKVVVDESTKIDELIKVDETIVVDEPTSVDESAGEFIEVEEAIAEEAVIAENPIIVEPAAKPEEICEDPKKNIRSKIVEKFSDLSNTQRREKLQKLQNSIKYPSSLIESKHQTSCNCVSCGPALRIKINNRVIPIFAGSDNTFWTVTRPSRIVALSNEEIPDYLRSLAG